MKLIIAEKPSVANSIAKIVNATTSKNGYKTGNGYIVSWCIGHLVTLANPDKYNEKYNDWNIEDLPILPDNFKTEIIKNTSGQYKILKELMLSNDVRELICATDAGREGELIFRLVYEKTGCKKPFKRLWISSMEDEAIRETKYFDIIPSNLNLASADLEFAKTGKEYILKETLVEIEKNYDFIILDTPPALGILTVNAFTYVDDIIIPTNASIFASSGIMQLFNSIETVKKYCNPNVKIDGILFTKFNKRTIIASEIKELTEIISKEIKTKVYKAQIRNSVMVEEAQANRIDIYSYDEKNNVSKDYMIFIDEYLSGLGKEKINV